MKTKLLALLLGSSLLMLLSFTENDHYIDSLNGELSRAKNEIRPLHFQTQIAAALDNKDSAVIILEYVIKRSAEIKERHVELEANKTLGAIYMALEDWDNAVPFISRTQFLAHKMRDTLQQADAMMNFAMVGTAKNNFKKSEIVFRATEGLLQITGLPDKTYLQKLAQVFHQHAKLFAQQQMLDSAQLREESRRPQAVEARTPNAP